MKKIYILSLLTACCSLSLCSPYAYGAAQPETAQNPQNTTTTTLPSSGKMVHPSSLSLSRLIQLGDACHHATQYHQAIQYYQAALKNDAQNSAQNHVMRSQIYHNLGMSYLALNLYDQAHFYYSEALKIKQVLRPTVAITPHTTISGAIGATHHNPGALYLDTHKPQTTIPPLSALPNTEWQPYVSAPNTKWYIPTAGQQAKPDQELEVLYEALLAQQEKMAYLNREEEENGGQYPRQINKKVQENQPTHPVITQSNPQPLPQLNSVSSNSPQQATPRLNPITIAVKKVSEKEPLQPHQSSQARRYPFSCDVCGKGFKYQSDFARHLRVHTGEKPFQCTICHKKFSKKYNMKIHMRLHSGEQPFQCTICHRKFSQKHSMQKHMCVHTGEKPFQCAICHKKIFPKAEHEKTYDLYS